MRKTVSYLRELPPDSLPRERLVNFGAKALSNQELLAILLGTGSQGSKRAQVCQSRSV